MQTNVPFDLKALRARLDITREQLAALLGVHLMTIRRSETRGEVSRVFQWALIGIIETYFIRVGDGYVKKPELESYLATLNN